ncbi:hypothetical protein KUBF_29040 [Bacteroides finegoldii]|nr:hypothetical protein KUBF_29040 [Bacteroides finegoldii]
MIQRVEAPEQIEQKKALKRVNDLLLRQNYISQSLYRFLRDERVEECVTEILKDILNLYNGKGRVYIFEYNKEHTYRSCTYEVVSEGCRQKNNVGKTYRSIGRNGGISRFCLAKLSF